MKSFIKFALLASVACSFNPADEVQAQRKFSFGRGNSNSGSGSNRNSGRSQSNGSGQSSFRSRFSGGNSGSSNNGSQNRSTQSSNTSTIKRDLNSFRKFSPRASVTPDKSHVGTTQQKTTTNSTDNGRLNQWRDVIRNSQKQDDSNLKKQIVSRFLNNGNSNSQTSGGGQSGQHTDSHQDRKERLGKFFNKVVTQNLHKNHWCHTRSSKCHWWVNYCKPISHCHADEIVVCNWSRVHCSPAVHVGIHQPAVQWYLGMKGILLPGKGIGIDTVEPGSPAEAVGLQPGMVLTVCNGIALVDEGAMQEAIRISGGVLQMTLLSADGSQVLEGSVRMTQIAAVSF